ncbi:MAG: hypothetical protein ABII22_06565 [Candidatus Micrarchaeota archaeon]
MDFKLISIFVAFLLVLSTLGAADPIPVPGAQQDSNILVETRVAVLYQESDCKTDAFGTTCEQKGLVPIVIQGFSKSLASSDEIQAQIQKCIRDNPQSANEKCGVNSLFGGQMKEYLQSVAMRDSSNILPTVADDGKVQVVFYGEDGTFLEGVDCTTPWTQVVSTTNADNIAGVGSEVEVVSRYCVISKQYYSKTCNSFVAFYAPGGKIDYNTRSNSIQLCDNEISALGGFRSKLSEIMNTATNVTYCFPFAILMGLLFASMYFSGKSPITLLDISSPKLPSPKTFAAGGQVLGGFGYSEMKKVAGGKMALAGKAIYQLSRAGVSGGLNARAEQFVDKSLAAKGKVEAYADKKAELGGQRTKDFLYGMYVGGTKAGFTHEQLSQLAMNPRHWGEKEQALAGKVINKLEGMKGSTGMLGANLKEFQFANVTQHHLEQLTGAPDIGKRSVVMLTAQSAVGKYMGLKHFAQIGGFFPAAFDSTVRSFQVFGRFGKAVVATPLKPVANALGLKTLHKHLEGWTGGLVDLGGFYPIRERMKNQYQIWNDEAKRDLMRGLMADMFRAKGMNFNMSAEQMLEIAYKKVDWLKKCGYSNDPRLQALERELRAILANETMTLSQKLEALVTLARSNNASSKTSAVLEELAVLERIENSGEESHVKMVRLYDHIANGRPNYEYAILHDNIDDPRKGHQMFEVLIFRSYIDQAENGHLAQSAGIKEVIMQEYLHELNRLITLRPNREMGADNISDSAKMLGKQFGVDPHVYHEIEQHALIYMKELITDEGRAVLDKYLAKNNKSFEQANIGDFFNVLYGWKEAYAHLGIDVDKQVVDPSLLIKGWGDKDLTESLKKGENPLKSDLLSAKEGAIRDPKSGQVIWLGDLDEIGPHANWWKADMKRHWQKEMDPRASFSITEWVNMRFTRAHYDPVNPVIERQLRQEMVQSGVNPDQTHTWTPNQVSQWKQKREQLWVLDRMKEDMKSYFNSTFGQNTYSNSRETANFYAKSLAGFLAASLNTRQDDLRTHKELESIDVGNRDALNHLGNLAQARSRSLEEYIKKGPTYNSIVNSGNPWVMMHEGGWAPHVHGMRLGQGDRVLGGYVAIQDEHGKWRRFDPDSVRVDFAKFGRGDLMEQYNRLGGGIHEDEQGMGAHQAQTDKRTGKLMAPERDPLGWAGFLAEVKDFTSKMEDKFEGKKMYNSILWSYTNHTGDYTRYYDESGARIISKRETTPNNPLRMFTLKQDTLFGTDMSVFQKVRNFGLGLGDYATKMALASLGPLHTASYGITSTSEVFRTASLRNAVAVLRMNENDWEAHLSDISNPRDRETIKKSLIASAVAHGAYHMVWDFAIDRNPQRISASHGVHQSWDSSFNFGPQAVYPMRQNMSHMTPTQYAMYMIQQGGLQSLAGAMLRPYASMFRAMQQEAQGYASKWDTTQDPLRHWQYTDVRSLNLTRVLTNPISTYRGEDSVTGWFKKKLGMDESSFRNPAEWAQLAGKDMARGLLQQPLDIMHYAQGGGLYANARTGEANPGASYYTYRHVLKTDPISAEYLVRGVGAQTEFYKNIASIRDQAYSKIYTREISDVGLQMRREQELRGFGFGQNTMNAWLTPLSYVWHSGILSPVGLGTPFTPFMAPKDIVMKAKTQGWLHALNPGNYLPSGANPANWGKGQSDLKGAAQRAAPWNAANVIVCTCGKQKLRNAVCSFCHKV